MVRQKRLNTLNNTDDIAFDAMYPIVQHASLTRIAQRRFLCVTTTRLRVVSAAITQSSVQPSQPCALAQLRSTLSSRDAMWLYSGVNEQYRLLIRHGYAILTLGKLRAVVHPSRVLLLRVSRSTSLDNAAAANDEVASKLFSNLTSRVDGLSLPASAFDYLLVRASAFQCCNCASEAFPRGLPASILRANCI